jgi:centriolin
MTHFAATRGVALPRVTVLSLELSPPDKIARIENLDLCPQLMELSLAGNLISKMENLSKLTSLTALNLADNRITLLAGFEKLVHLEKLDVSGNLIEHIPGEIAALKRLRVLRFGRNRLSVLRDLNHLKPLAHLVNLDALHGNVMLSQLPHARLFTIFTLPSLTVLDAAPISLTDRQQADSRFNRDEVEMLQIELAESKHKQGELSTKVQELSEAFAKVWDRTWKSQYNHVL